MFYEITKGKRYEKLVVDAMDFIIDHLKIPSDVWVSISLERSDRSCGGCVHLEDDEYEVDINTNQTKEEIVATLFHEMKHVEQKALGYLQETVWKGKDYKSVPYMDQPWEKEAYDFESRTISLYYNKS